MKYKTIIFDLDGTLLDTLDDLADSVNAILTRHGFPPRTRAEVRAFTGNGSEHLIRLSLPADSSEETVRTVLGEYVLYYKQHCQDKTRPYAGVVALLEKLRQAGCRCAVVSNKPEEAVRALCRRHFGALAAATAGDRPDRQRKPAPDAVLAALRDLGSDGTDAVCVGDSEVDILTARNAGLPCISVTWGFRDRDALLAAGAEVLAEDMEALYRALADA